MRLRELTSIVCVAALAGGPLAGQQSNVLVQKPTGPVLIRPYEQTHVPPAWLHNSSRLHSLIRAGKLYLTVEDAIALAIENNLDLEVDRYGPLQAEWQVQRAEAGGPLRGVTNGNSLVNQVANGQGVIGSQVSAGLSNTGNGNGNNGGNAIISQIGPVTANLDAVLQNTSLYSHITIPQPNTVQSQTSALVDVHHIFNTFVQQGLLSGGYVQVAANESYLKENTPTDILNPSVAPVSQIYLRHNLLQGFGTGVNSRFIRVARINVGLAGQTFRSQLLNIVASTLNLYWDLVAGNEDVRSRRQTLAVAQKFNDDTKLEIKLGGVARVEAYRAEAELSTRKQELAIAQSSMAQQETLLKNALSRNGLSDPLLDAAEVVPLDHIEVPETEDLPPLRDLVKLALTNRPDIELSNINLQTSEISALGTANGLLPQLQVIASASGSGLAGAAAPQADGSVPEPFYVGGLGTALGQVAQHHYGSERGGILFQGTPGNRIAQGDYGVDQLQLRQNQLIARRSMNQIVVDISNQVVALRQARARYSAAVNTRNLEEQLLQKEQQKFGLGSSTIDDVIAVQRSLAGAQTVEVAALSIYSRARVSYDQVLGLTLARHHVSVREALSGRVARESRITEPELKP